MRKKVIFHEESFKYIQMPKGFRKEGEATHGKGRHKAKKVGDNISFKVPGGRRTGTVLEAHKEHYIVKSKRSFYKVNRRSILYAMGKFAGKVISKPRAMKETVKRGYRESYEEQMTKASGKKWRFKKPRKKRKKKKKKPEGQVQVVVYAGGARPRSTRTSRKKKRRKKKDPYDILAKLI